MPNLILHNAKCITQEVAYRQATAVAIRGDRILALGTDDEILELGRQSTRRINLQGNVIIPGLTDGHVHFRPWALGLEKAPLAGVGSKDELLGLVSQQAQQLQPGEWLQAQGWNEAHWEQALIPTRWELDAAAPSNPVFLTRADLHMGLANSAALAAAGVTRDTPDPAGGLIDRQQDSQLSGGMRELAMDLITAVIPPLSETQALQAITRGLKRFHQLGLTGFHDFSGVSASRLPATASQYQQLAETQQLKMRILLGISGELLDQSLALGLRSGFGDQHLRIGHLKLFADGSQGSRTAWMFEPYLDSGGCGLPITSMHEIGATMRRATAGGIAVAVHAIGDRAVSELIDLYQHLPARGANGAARLLPRIEHVQNIRLQDVPRMAKTGAVASVQPIHLRDDVEMIETSVGGRGRFAYLFATLLKAGIPLALGSDCPVADPDPFAGIYAAVSRRKRDGSPEEGWYPAERLSVEQALWGYTMGNALVSGRADELGSLLPGKLADLVVIDRDLRQIPMQEIPDTRVRAVLVGGEVVYDDQLLG